MSDTAEEVGQLMDEITALTPDVGTGIESYEANHEVNEKIAELAALAPDIARTVIEDVTRLRDE